MQMRQLKLSVQRSWLPFLGALSLALGLLAPSATAVLGQSAPPAPTPTPTLPALAESATPTPPRDTAPGTPTPTPTLVPATASATATPTVTPAAALPTTTVTTAVVATSTTTATATATPAPATKTPTAAPTGTPEATATSRSIVHANTLSTPNGPGGAVWAWGTDQNGDLGDGRSGQSVGDVNQPVSVGSLAGVVQIAAATSWGVGLRYDGTAWEWGDSPGVQYGGTSATTPTQVSGLTNVVAVAAADIHGLALESDGTVWQWGHSNLTTMASGYQPVQVPGLAGAVAIAASNGADAAVLADGTVWQWGTVMDGAQSSHSNQAPVQVPGISSATSVVMDPYFGLVVNTDGTVWGWGSDQGGGLANVTTTFAATAQQVAGLSNVVALTVSHEHALALDSSGGVWGWGNSDGYGYLGQRTCSGSACTLPTRLNNLPSIAALSTSTTHTVAISTAGAILGWGDNSHGQLGPENPAAFGAPVVLRSLSNARAIAAGSYATDAAAAGVAASPQVLQPGNQLTVTGSGFATTQGTSVTAVLLDSNNAIAVTLGTITPTYGGISQVFTIPSSLAQGVYTLRASDGTNSFASLSPLVVTRSASTIVGRVLNGTTPVAGVTVSAAADRIGPDCAFSLGGPTTGDGTYALFGDTCRYDIYVAASSLRVASSQTAFVDAQAGGTFNLDVPVQATGTANSGLITDADTHQPLSGATLEILLHRTGAPEQTVTVATATTDGSGTASLPYGVAPGTYDVEANAVAYKPSYVFGATVSGNASQQQSFPLVHYAVTISGRILSNGSPVAGIVPHIYCLNTSGDGCSYETDTPSAVDGSYTIRGDRALYDLYVTSDNAAGVNSSTTTFLDATGPTTSYANEDVNVHPASVQVTGTDTDAASQALLSNGTVELQIPSRASTSGHLLTVAVGHTGTNGSATFTAAAGTYTPVGNAVGYPATPLTTTTIGGNAAAFTFPLTHYPVTISGRVNIPVDNGGLAHVWPSATCVTASGGSCGYEFADRADANGYFTLYGDHGTYDLYLNGDNDPAANSEASTLVDATSGSTLYVANIATVATTSAAVGTVTDAASGAAIRDALVSVLIPWQGNPGGTLPVGTVISRWDGSYALPAGPGTYAGVEAVQEGAGGYLERWTDMRSVTVGSTSTSQNVTLSTLSVSPGSCTSTCGMSLSGAGYVPGWMISTLVAPWGGGPLSATSPSTLPPNSSGAFQGTVSVPLPAAELQVWAAQSISASLRVAISSTPYIPVGSSLPGPTATPAPTSCTDTLGLSQGWNLVSFGVTPANNSLTSVLSSISGQYDVVYGFDQNQGGTTSYFTDPSKAILNNLSTLQPFSGYWIHTTAAATARIAGQCATTSVNTTLQPGWNLVGWHGPSAALSAALGAQANSVDVVYGFDPNQGGTTSYFTDPNKAILNNLSSLSPNSGYWIHETSASATTWQVAPGAVPGAVLANTSVAPNPPASAESSTQVATPSASPDPGSLVAPRRPLRVRGDAADSSPANLVPATVAGSAQPAVAH